MAISYTNEQIKGIRENLKLISLKATDLLKTISNEDNINHSDLHQKSAVGKSVTDKCLSAFLVSGLIERIDDGAKRFYCITADGKKLLELEGEQ